MTHIVLANAGGEIRELELDDVILMFFDTLMATLNAAFQGHPGTPFDFFEYEDDDGERLSVRTDEELQTFLVELLQMGQNLPKIHLKSSRALMRQQISFDESDDLIMASQCAGSSAENGSIIASSDIGNGNSPTTIKAISPEDLQLVERLSDGQFGTVYKALDVKYDRLLAVKCISVDDTSGTRQGLLNEIAILKRSSHPNIVTFHAALFVENQLLIIMELMDALSLDLYGQLPTPVLGAVTVGVVEGLAHLWSRSIMHRDIKPSNFLVNTAGEVKLGDFGVSKQMALSVAWSYVGTKVYMAPERIDGEVYNVASDVWSLGVALAEMGLGKFPFQAEVGATNATVDSLLYSQARIATLLAEPALIAVGNGFVALLTACLALKPHQRIGPEAIVASQFLNTHRPMNKGAIVKFIAEKKAMDAEFTKLEANLECKM